MICIEDCYHVTPIEYAAQVDNGAQSLEIVELLHTFASRPLTRRNPESHLTLLHWAARGDTEAQCPGERPFAAPRVPRISIHPTYSCPHEPLQWERLRHEPLQWERLRVMRGYAFVASGRAAVRPRPCLAT